MSQSNPNTILLLGNAISKEGVATEAITPGMLLERVNRSGVADGFATHNSSAAEKGPFLIAREMELVGNTIDDAYEIDDRILLWVCEPGSEVMARLASGQNITAGAELMSDAAGALTLKTSTNPTRAVAMESANNSAGAVPLIRVEVVK